MNAGDANFLPLELIINVPAIDEQHAELFALLAHLKDRCVESNCLLSVDATALVEALSIHCATEEGMARQANVDFAAHARKHQEMLKGITKTLDEVREDRMDVFSLIRYIEYWFERHIREEDKNLGLQLQRLSSGSTRLPREAAGQPDCRPFDPAP